MLLRLVIALVLGALIGLERELIGKEAGVRTCMTVSAGAAIFSIVGISIVNPAVIANVVVGIGFLGAGMLIQTQEKVRGLTTAAIIWVVASIGVLVGVGLISFAVISAVLITVLLYILRGLNIGPK